MSHYPLYHPLIVPDLAPLFLIILAVLGPSWDLVLSTLQTRLFPNIKAYDLSTYSYINIFTLFLRYKNCNALSKFNELGGLSLNLGHLEKNAILRIFYFKIHLLFLFILRLLQI